MKIKDVTILMKFCADMLPMGKPNIENSMVLKFWANALNEYSDEDVRLSFKTAANTLDRYPTLNQFKAILGGNTLTRNEQAISIVSRITKAIPKYGGYQHESAAEYIGSEGWESVTRFGGWDQICMTDGDKLTYVSNELRKITDVILADGGHTKNGHLAITSNKSEGRKMIDAQLKKLTTKKDDDK